MKLFQPMIRLSLAALLLTIGSMASAAPFTSYVIRNSTVGNIAPTIVNGPQTTFIINQAGQKAGYGTNAINGTTIGQIQGLTITRFDPTNIYPAGSGPAFAPYLNIWVTDGVNYAVLANEPTNPAFQPLFVDNGDGTHTYNLDFSDLASHPVQVYETQNGGFNSTNTWVHNLLGINGPLKFSDVAGLMIGAPSAAFIAGSPYIGGGAPRELGSNTAYGVNWIFGDSLGNYQSSQTGYIVGLADVSAATVPEPASIAVWSLVSVAGLAAWRRRKAAKAA